MNLDDYVEVINTILTEMGCTDIEHSYEENNYRIILNLPSGEQSQMNLGDLVRGLNTSNIEEFKKEFSGMMATSLNVINSGNVEEILNLEDFHLEFRPMSDPEIEAITPPEDDAFLMIEGDGIHFCWMAIAKGIAMPLTMGMYLNSMNDHEIADSLTQSYIKGLKKREFRFLIEELANNENIPITIIMGSHIVELLFNDMTQATMLTNISKHVSVLDTVAYIYPIHRDLVIIMNDQDDHNPAFKLLAMSIIGRYIGRPSMVDLLTTNPIEVELTNEPLIDINVTFDKKYVNFKRFKRR